MNLICICTQQPTETETNTSDHTILPSFVKEAPSESMYRSSPFFKHFSRLLSDLKPIDHGDDNDFYNVELLQIILNKYLAYYCLWGGTILRLKIYAFNRISNAPVENYFGVIKNNVLNGQYNIKVSRLVRTIREHVLSLTKERNLNIRKTQLTTKKIKHKRNKEDVDNETCSQEQWDKKQKTTNYYFVGKHLATQYINNVESKQDKSIDYKFTKCTYCRKSTLDEIHPTKWVMCDICDC